MATSPHDNRWIGLDVGGAHLKASDGRVASVSTPLALWREPERLREVAREVLLPIELGSAQGVALTMTGELADCFETKAEGVERIVQAVVEAAKETPVRVATVDDRWLTPAEAVAAPRLVSSANWRVLARLGAQLLGDGPGLLLDIGSTTADLVLTDSRRVASIGRTDTERLLASELVYTGVRRTPVCAVARELPCRGRACPVAAELFATVDDAWLVLGLAAETPSRETADGRPRSVPYAHARLARCVCEDTDTFFWADALAAAEAIASAQVELVAAAIAEQLKRKAPRRVLVSGEGEFLALKALALSGVTCATERLSDRIGAMVSTCAPAYACAVLAERELE